MINHKKIYNFVKKEFNKTNYFNYGVFDETYFTLRVYESAKEIISKLEKKIKREEVLVASLLHDIGKTKIDMGKAIKDSNFAKDGKFLKKYKEKWNQHAKFSANIAQDYLKKEGFSKDFIKNVSFLIKNHDFRNLDSSEKTLELKILQDADLIADIGLSGFIRVFAFSGEFNHSIIDSIKFLDKEDRTLNGEILNLDVSKKIAKKEMKIQKDLVKKMKDKISSDLIGK